MRLLNVFTKQFKEYSDEETCPPYMILSHTWGNEEVSFQELAGPHHATDPIITSKAGYRKILGCCNIAIACSCEWVWIDTCNIDKTSSAELSEAINSMFRWYQNSTRCIVYLADVADGPDHIDHMDSEFRRSRWFTRGWTLQELIAPEHIEFFNQSWERLGEKARLSDLIQEITRIPLSRLSRPLRPSLAKFSVAQRMSWAASRTTTRPEDTAYCLLGIFDINMTLLYGEGAKAFQRLQQEIIKHVEDQSILAWGYQPMPGSTTIEDLHSEFIGPSTEDAAVTTASALARSPLDFLGCGEVVIYDLVRMSETVSDVSSRGLRLEMRIINRPAAKGHLLYGVLNCGQSGRYELIVIPLFNYGSAFRAHEPLPVNGCTLQRVANPFRPRALESISLDSKNHAVRVLYLALDQPDELRSEYKGTIIIQPSLPSEIEALYAPSHVRTSIIDGRLNVQIRRSRANNESVTYLFCQMRKTTKGISWFLPSTWVPFLKRRGLLPLYSKLMQPFYVMVDTAQIYEPKIKFAVAFSDRVVRSNGMELSSLATRPILPNFNFLDWSESFRVREGAILAEVEESYWEQSHSVMTLVNLQLDRRWPWEPRSEFYLWSDKRMARFLNRGNAYWIWRIGSYYLLLSLSLTCILAANLFPLEAMGSRAIANSLAICGFSFLTHTALATYEQYQKDLNGGRAQPISPFAVIVACYVSMVILVVAISSSHIATKRMFAGFHPSDIEEP